MYFKGSDAATPLAKEALEDFFLYGMDIQSQSEMMGRASSLLAVNKKRIDEQAEEGLQATIGNAFKKPRRSRPASRKQRQVFEERDFKEDEAGEGDSEECGDSEEDDLERAEMMDSDHEENAFSTPPSKRAPSSKAPATGTMDKLANLTDFIRMRALESTSNAQSSREVELRKLEIEEKRHNAMLAMIEAQREQERLHREQERADRREEFRLQQEMMMAMLQAIQGKKQ